jgi:hypothetical protein
MATQHVYGRTSNPVYPVYSIQSTYLLDGLPISPRPVCCPERGALPPARRCIPEELLLSGTCDLRSGTDPEPGTFVLAGHYHNDRPYWKGGSGLILYYVPAGPPRRHASLSRALRRPRGPARLNRILPKCSYPLPIARTETASLQDDDSIDSCSRKWRAAWRDEIG